MDLSRSDCSGGFFLAPLSRKEIYVCALKGRYGRKKRNSFEISAHLKKEEQKTPKKKKKQQQQRQRGREEDEEEDKEVKGVANQDSRMKSNEFAFNPD
jgi:hypothetical protein